MDDRERQDRDRSSSSSESRCGRLQLFLEYKSWHYYQRLLASKDTPYLPTYPYEPSQEFINGRETRDVDAEPAEVVTDSERLAFTRCGRSNAADLLLCSIV